MMKSTNRIIFNTGITYARAIITAFISLYATRLILNALGAEDFGLYNVIGGLVGLLSFLNAAMTTSTQRYISFNLGKQDKEIVRQVFSNSVIIHYVLAVIVVVLIEIVALYLINYQLQINPIRLHVAKSILHFVVASTFITIISVPYDAIINAHENMSFLAIVSIIEALFRLVIAFTIVYLPGDKLFIYGLLMMISSIAIRIIKQTYSRQKYEECCVSLKKYYNLSQIKELSSFAGWNLFGVLCSLGRNQGIAIVLNLFYTTVVNAAYGIANQINGQIMFFSQTMMSAVRPQIMKSEGANNRSHMIRLALSANKFSFFLFTFFAIPLYFQMPFVLKIWLKDVPQYSVEFCRAILFLTAANQINMGLMTAVQAIGKIKYYQMVAGGIQLVTLPIGFVFLKYGYPPYSIVLVSFVLECASTVFRVYYFNHLANYPVEKYLKHVILTSLVTMIPPILLILFFSMLLQIGWWSLVTISIISVLSYSVSIYLLGLDKIEKEILKSVVNKIVFKMKITR